MLHFMFGNIDEAYIRKMAENYEVSAMNAYNALDREPLQANIIETHIRANVGHELFSRMLFAIEGKSDPNLDEIILAFTEPGIVNTFSRSTSVIHNLIEDCREEYKREFRRKWNEQNGRSTR